MPKSERNPSAAPPQRARACERSCRQARTRSPCPAPSLTMAGRSGMGAMLATSSRASRVGGLPHPVAGTGVGRVADVAHDRHDERCELPLSASRRADVEGVRAAAERRRDRAAVCASTPGRPRCDRRQAHPMRWTRCPTAPGGRWRRFRPADRSRWPPPRHAKRGFRGQGRRCGDRSTGARPPSWRPSSRGGMEQGREQRAGALGPVIRRASRARSAGWHRPSHRRSRSPRPNSRRTSTGTNRRVRRRAGSRPHRSGRRGTPTRRCRATVPWHA